MNIVSALAHLGRAGVTAEVLAAEDVDPTDPTAVRQLVETLLGAALTGSLILVGMPQIGALQQALAALITDAERVEGDAVAQRIAVILHTANTTSVEACLEST